MICSSFLKAAAAPHPAPSRTTWWVNTQEKSRTTWWVDTQEQRYGLTFRCGRNWSFPASVKIEDSEYFLLHSTKDEINRPDRWALTICLLPFVALVRVLAPGFSPGLLASFIVLNRIRGLRDLNSENLYQQQLVFLSSHVFLHVRCTAHCTFNRV